MQLMLPASAKRQSAIVKEDQRCVQSNNMYVTITLTQYTFRNCLFCVSDECTSLLEARQLCACLVRVPSRVEDIAK